LPYINISDTCATGRTAQAALFKKRMSQLDIFVDRNSPVPPYQQIKSRIINLIEGGELQENQEIESVRSIARIAGVSPATAQKAFYELKQLRLIYPKAGSGYYVAKKAPFSKNLFYLHT
jgi:DNA-binding transcriptional regulator YhcF (GntR family)